MKTFLLLFIFAAVSAVAFADGVKELEEKGDMINYCKLLMKNGHLNGIVENEDDLEKKTLEQLYDIAIEGNRAAIRKNPNSTNLRETYIKHLEGEKAKLIKTTPEPELDMSRKLESEPQPDQQSNQEQMQNQEPQVKSDVETSSEATNEKPKDKLSFTQKVVKLIKGFF